MVVNRQRYLDALTEFPSPLTAWQKYEAIVYWIGFSRLDHGINDRDAFAELPDRVVSSITIDHPLPFKPYHIFRAVERYLDHYDWKFIGDGDDDDDTDALLEAEFYRLLERAKVNFFGEPSDDYNPGTIK